MSKLKSMIKRLLKEKKYSVKDILAEIYNLYQDYIIDEDQEAELYKAADPKNKFNRPADYWFSEKYGCHELYEAALKL